jgi:hypothetical protein
VWIIAARRAASSDDLARVRRRQREACLDALVADLAATGARMLVLKTDIRVA